MEGVRSRAYGLADSGSNRFTTCGDEDDEGRGVVAVGDDDEVTCVG